MRNNPFRNLNMTINSRLEVISPNTDIPKTDTISLLKRFTIQFYYEL